MKRSELLSRILMVSGIFLALAAPFAARIVGRAAAIEVHGRMAESGGWTPGVIRAQAGVPLRLRLTSADVIHGFAVGQSAVAAVDVLPGQVTETTLTFDKPGTYTFYCTRWCGPNHWRMRGTIEVSGDEVASPQPGEVPLYITLGLDIDAAHPAAMTPFRTPDAGRGAEFSSLLSIGTMSSEYYRSHSPAQAYLDLRADPALTGFSDPEIWDLVAYIWQANTSPDRLAEGQRLFAQNCAACHGETGGGNGVFSEEINALAGRYPADLSNPAAMLGASPALLQGKILRGGMGTGMPSWGPILTEQQTWDLISYLFTFQFKGKTN